MFSCCITLAAYTLYATSRSLGDVLCVWVWCMGLSHTSWTGKATRISWVEDETSVHEFSVEGVQDFLLASCRALKFTHLAEVQILQCCWAIWARESKHIADFGIGTLGGLLILEGYVSFSTARFGSYILWNGCCCLTSESTGILPCRDPQWVVGNCSRFICIHLWDTCIRPRISRSSGRSLEITCCPGKIPLFCPVHTAVGRHLEAGHWTTHPPPSLLAMQWST